MTNESGKKKEMEEHLLVMAVVAYLEGDICLVSEHPYRVGTVRVVAG